MLTLFAFTAIVLAFCVFLLSDRYKLNSIWVTFVAILFAVCVAAGVSMEQQYESLWFVVSLNVVLLSAILAVHCYGNQEKLEWTETLERNTVNIFSSLETTKHELSELNKRLNK